jgi:hypothetical protein
MTVLSSSSQTEDQSRYLWLGIPVFSMPHKMIAIIGKWLELVLGFTGQQLMRIYAWKAFFVEHPRLA